MKKTIRNIILYLLTFAFILGAFTGCAKESATKPENLVPEYTAAVPFESHASGGIHEGIYTIDGEKVFIGENFINVERMKEYKEAGFDVLYISSMGITANEDFEKSNAKKLMDTALEAGIDRAILVDFYLWDMLTAKNGKMVGEGSEYLIDSTNFTEPEYEGDERTKEERALDKAVWDHVKRYFYHPCFYGISMYDEPSYKLTENFGRVYKSLRRVAEKNGKPEMTLYSNLGPLGFASTRMQENPTDFREAFTSYVENYVLATDCDRLSVDIYAFRRQGIFAGYFQTLQIFREICSKYNVKMEYVGQSFNMFEGSLESYAFVSKSEMMYEANVALGMGVTGYNYYTYFPDLSYSTEGIKWRETSTFLTMDGTRNNVYYYGQEILNYMRSFNEVISNFEYQGAKFYYTDGLPNFDNAPYRASYIDGPTGTPVVWDNSHEFSLVKKDGDNDKVTLDNDVLFMTELKDSKNDLYMYMLMNAIDPRNGDGGSRTDETVSVDFGSEYGWVAEYDCGQLRYVKLNNGVYEKTLSAGYAVYLIPIKN